MTPKTFASHLGIALVLAFVCLSVAQASIEPEAISDTKQFFQRLEKLGFSGVVLIGDEGDCVFAQGFGMADRENEVKYDTSTVSTIGSITKQFTGAAILLLEERGRLKVEDSITNYFDNVPSDKHSITIHQLLTHSSGIVDLDGVDDFDEIYRDEFVRQILAQDLEFAPGTGYAYSNAGYSLLGAIIETLTGQTYEQFVRDELFIANEMHQTGYILPDWDMPHVAQGYKRDGGWGTVLEKPMADDGPYWVLRANGGIHSTGHDMLRWADALLNGRVLSPESMEKYWAPHVDEGGGESFYGYGWVVMTRHDGTRVITHNGSNRIFFADMMIIPNQELVLFVQTNTYPLAPVVNSVLESMARRILDGEPYDMPPDVATQSEYDLSTVAGTYRLDDNNSLEIRGGDGSIRIIPHGRSAFSRLHGTRAFDPERSERLCRRIDDIVGATLSGNFDPLFNAYEQQVPIERLKAVRTAQRDAWESEYGPLKGHHVLGTALRTPEDITVVRYSFERGSVERAYVWDKDEKEKLMGISRRGLDPALYCVPVQGGGFASWDPNTGQSRPLRIESDGTSWKIVLGRGDTLFIATRVP